MNSLIFLPPKGRGGVVICPISIALVLFSGSFQKQEQDKSSDIEQQPPFGDRKISNIQPPKFQLYLKLMIMQSSGCFSDV